MSSTEHIPSPVHTGKKLPAKYREQDEPTYRYNRLIEALPRHFTTDECLEMLKILPVYSTAECKESACYRLNAVNRLSKLRIPMTDDIITYNKLTHLFSEGYFNRNPSSADWIKQLNSGFPGLLKETAENDYDWAPQFCNSSLGYGLFGASGSGKTWTIESVLNFWPQVIVHSSYRGQPFDLQQLVWLKLDCPVKGSAKSLCLDFIYSIDNLLGTSYYNTYNRLSADAMLVQMARMSASISLGALVVDEIHRLYEAFSGGEKALLNFFIKLANTVKIPVILMGTFKSLKLFSKDFSLARRIAGQGDHLISHKENGREWKYFLDHLWRYQFTNVHTPLTEGIANALYDESQGLVDIAVKLYKMAQWSVIGTRCESITPELITNISEVNFNAARPMLQALRSKDFEKLAEIEDLIPHDDDLQAFLKNSVSRIIITGSSATLGNLQQTADMPSAVNLGIDPVNEIASRLIAVGIDSDRAHDCAKTAFLRFEKSTDLLEATKEALRLTTSPQETNGNSSLSDPIPVQEKIKPSIPPHRGDLRVIAGGGKKLQKETTVQNLREGGMIKSPCEFL